jgi:hypothetical protein
LPSLQAVPSGWAGVEHTPVVGEQVPATWHWSVAVHRTGFEPVQLPFWQLSDCVQALPSLQLLPLVLFGDEQVPVPGLQVPASWHWSAAVHSTGLAPEHVPL